MSSSAQDIWLLILNDIKSQINSQTFSTWFSDTKAVFYDGINLSIQVQDETAKRHISDTYISLIQSSAHKNTGKTISISFMVGSSDSTTTFQTQEIIQQTSISRLDNTSASKFNPKYLFETFVVGPTNQLAFAAATSIAKTPAKQYNPFFLYGESGLGKTHLLQAICNELKKENPHLKVMYTSSEQFISEFIQSIATKTQHSFKIKYRNVDVLLIDDIQNLKDKEGTQEEFFYTFEDLYKNNKQIVISSDRPPREIASLADRLRTRFEWGLQADIKAPNIETREAILRKKSIDEGIVIQDEVLNYIAKRIKTNIRKLEASLTNLKAVSLTYNVPITIDLAKQHLKHLFDEEVSRNITIRDIMEKVSERMNVNVDDLRSKSRHSSIVQPRFIAMYICTKLTSLTTIEIGKEFGNRDHSTVINARNNIQKLIDEDDTIKEKIDDIISELKS